jgi:hypothetical protein
VRWMLVRFQRLSWAEMVVVAADTACASQANIQLIWQRGYCFVMAFVRTGCFDNGQALKALVTHLPKMHDRRSWVLLEEPSRIYTKRARLYHISNVTIILRKKQRHYGPQATQILVTNRPDVTARQVVDVYRRRWTVELCQTQPIKMAWCPHRRFRRAMREPRRRCKRENAMDVNGFTCHDDFVDQALRYGLTLFKRKPFHIMVQQLAKGLGMGNDLLPEHGLVPRVG